MRCAIVLRTVAVAPGDVGVDWAGTQVVKAARLAVARKFKIDFMFIEVQAGWLRGGEGS